MRVFQIWSLLLGISISASGQGTLLFSTSVPGAVDAPFFNLGKPFGPEFKAQLFARPPGFGEFLPLFPITTFRFDNEVRGHVVPAVVTVPGLASGRQIEVLLRAFSGPTLEATDRSCIAVSGPVVATLGGGDLPPGVLRGLRSVEIGCIPEPPPWVLSSAGLLALLIWHRFLRHSHS